MGNFLPFLTARNDVFDSQIHDRFRRTTAINGCCDGVGVRNTTDLIYQYVIPHNPLGVSVSINGQKLCSGDIVRHTIFDEIGIIGIPQDGGTSTIPTIWFKAGLRYKEEFIYRFGIPEDIELLDPNKLGVYQSEANELQQHIASVERRFEAGTVLKNYAGVMGIVSEMRNGNTPNVWVNDGKKFFTMSWQVFAPNDEVKILSGRTDRVAFRFLEQLRTYRYAAEASAIVYKCYNLPSGDGTILINSNFTDWFAKVTYNEYGSIEVNCWKNDPDSSYQMVEIRSFGVPAVVGEY
jgi:hypothetical protein